MEPREPTLPIILVERCIAWGDCAAICPAGALDLQQGHAVLAWPADCAYCGDCECLCPAGAIVLPLEIVFAHRLPMLIHGQ